MSDEYLDKIYSQLGRISDYELREGCYSFLRMFEEKFSTWPASITFHHIEEGGLIKHTYEVIKLGLEIADLMDVPVNKDYVIVAGFLHDFGKINDYTENPEFEHKFIHTLRPGPDHSLFPMEYYPNVTGKLLPPEVVHAILAHMGGWSQTSVFPETILDAIIHSADLISSRMG